MSKYIFADSVFFACTTLFCFLALQGSLDLTPLGVNMDSDLQNYAQILESKRYPDAFTMDPVVPLFHADPGVPNLLTSIAQLPFFGSDAATALLRVGNIAIFLHFLAYYILGRYLFSLPSIAAILSLVMSITVYWAFGTFWGNLHSDPVPRFFFADLWPFLFILALKATEKRSLQPVLFFLTGCCITVHTVSTLMVGPMFFFAFAIQNTRRPLKSQIKELVKNGVFFAIPVVCYLAWLLYPFLALPTEQVFFDVRDLRFGNDFTNLHRVLGGILLKYCYAPPLLPTGLICWWIAYKNSQRLPNAAQQLVKLLPGLVFGILCMCCICAIEITLAESIGKNNMSQEILRGTRFLIPLSWLAIVTVVYLLFRRIPSGLRVCVVIGTIFALLIFMQEKQVIAARHALAEYTGIKVLDTEKAQVLRKYNYAELEMLNALKKNKDEYIFSPDDAMGIRYIAHCNLLPVYKDGNVIYYARNKELANLWLKEQKVLRSSPSKWIDIWNDSKATILVTKKKTNLDLMFFVMNDVLFDNNEWIIAKKKQSYK